MIEIVFSESAGGSLKVAQHFGEGNYRGVSTVILGHSDGREATQGELEQARQEFERKEQEALKNIIHSSILIQMTRTYLYENTMELVGL